MYYIHRHAYFQSRPKQESIFQLKEQRGSKIFLLFFIVFALKTEYITSHLMNYKYKIIMK